MLPRVIFWETVSPLMSIKDINIPLNPCIDLYELCECIVHNIIKPP